MDSLSTATGGQMIVKTGFERVLDRLTEAAAADGDYAAAVCVYVAGECVVDVWTENTLAADAIFPVFSSTKGMAGVVVGRLVDQSLIDLDEPVASYWPQFSQAGKSTIQVRTLLSHQAGLPGVRDGYDFAEVIEHHRLAERLAAERPLWSPGKAHGYHPLTLGTLADELVLRTTGRRLGELFATEVAGPLGADFYIGLPPQLADRVVDIENSRTPGLVEPPSGFRVIASPLSSFAGPAEIVNDQGVRKSGQAAVSGVGDARALARIYAACIGAVDGVQLMRRDTVDAVSQLQTFGPDLVSGDVTGFATMFQKPGPSGPFGSYSAFGHAGAGGSLGYADPHYGIAFGYVTKRMPEPGATESSAITLSRLVRACVTGR